MGKIILVIGGGRSGKSKFAEKLALKLGNNRAAYIATAEIFDDEMKNRVKIHRERRGNEWTTFESPFNADKTISEVAKNFDVILFDCVTVYLSNFLCNTNLDDNEKIFADFENLIKNLIDSVKKSDSTVIFVTNEVGAGIVPENKLARKFRDLAGIANQMLATESEQVFMTVAGIAIDLKMWQLSQKIILQ